MTKKEIFNSINDSTQEPQDKKNGTFFFIPGQKPMFVAKDEDLSRHIHNARDLIKTHPERAKELEAVITRIEFMKITQNAIQEIESAQRMTESDKKILAEIDHSMKTGIELKSAVQAYTGASPWLQESNAFRAEIVEAAPSQYKEFLACIPQLEDHCRRNLEKRAKKFLEKRHAPLPQ